MTRALVIVSLLFGCGTSARTLGAVCTADSECETGLGCKPNFVGGQCTTTMTCTKDCTGDAVCQALDPKGKCLQGCGTAQICMLTP